jgi:Trypsin
MKNLWLFVAMSSKARMNYIRAYFICLIAALMLTPTSAMVGGAPAATDGPGRSVFMILGDGGTVCTSTAIARDLLLTASHCVLPGSEYKLLLGAPSEHPLLKDIARIERNPQFDLKRLFGHLATADVALLKLTEPLPDKIPAMPLGAEEEPVAVGDAFVVAGYGVTVRGDGRTAGTLRAATLVATGQPGTLQIRLVDPKTNDDSPGLGACAGDSGAPVLRDKDGRTVIIGVVSWSTGPKLQGGCGGLTGVTPLARYRAWIVDAARRLGSPLPP